MIRLLFPAFILFLLLTPVAISLAVSDVFTVRTLIGSDITPPTTPTLSSVVPASTSQIDVTWTASTDDFLLGGYQVFRNSVQIATTTLTTYSDSGLSQSTLYTYFVRAFDSSFNYSSSSNALATTTLTPTSTSTPESTTKYGSKSSPVDTFSIVPERYSALFSWSTSKYVKFYLRWGRTTSYELGFVSNDELKRSHTTEIGDLRPGTVYEYELILYGSDGNKLTSKRGQFKTLDAPDTTAPPNVNNLNAYIVDGSVYLSWENPQVADFSRVRILRNHLFYPANIYDGFFAYEGSDESVTDNNALLTSPFQYYTVFAIDTSGNVSSGAIVAVVKEGSALPENDNVPKESATIPLRFTDFEFIQNDVPVGEEGINSEGSFTVRIAYHKLPEHLKTITMTLRDVEDPTKTLSYLLRINKEKTYYEAELPARRETGEVLVSFSVYDFQKKTLENVSGSVVFYKRVFDTGTHFAFPFSTTLAVNADPIGMGAVVLLFFLVFALFRFFKRGQ